MDLPLNASHRRIRWTNTVGRTRALYCRWKGKQWHCQVCGFGMQPYRFRASCEAEIRSRLRGYADLWGGGWRRTYDSGPFDRFGGEWPGFWQFLTMSQRGDAARKPSKPGRTMPRPRKARGVTPLAQRDLFPAAVAS